MAIKVLNRMVANPEETPIVNVSMTNPIYRGPEGPVGPVGPQGQPGPEGKPGPQGPKGDSLTFNDLTPEQKEELRGPQGIQGEPGKKGDKGDQGAIGPQGPQGIQGENYVLTEEDKNEIAGLIDVPDVDLNNYYTKAEVDEAIANIDIPEGEIVDEVYVGTAAPTDENVKIWVNPEEELEFATVAYVDEAVAGAGGGSGNGYVFDGNLQTRSFTAADKAKFAEIYNGYITNGKLIECDLWIKVSTGTSYEKITRIEYISGTNPPRMYFYTVNKQGLMVTFNASTGAYSGSQSAYFGDDVQIKGWYWCDGLSGMQSYSHIKIVGYFDGNTSDIASFDISTSNNNYFSEEEGTYYYCVWSYQGEVNSISFYNYQGEVHVANFNSDQSHSFEPFGYWYWG